MLAKSSNTLPAKPAKRENIQFPLNDQSTCRNNRCALARRILNDDDVVAALLEHGVELVGEALFRDIADGGEDAQAVEEAGAKVVAAEGAQDVAFGEGGLDGGGEEVIGEEVGHGGG